MDVEIVIPVYNEELGLARSVRRLHGFLADGFPFSWRITIADNASADSTLAIARKLERELPGVGVVHVDAKGRGRALRAAWLASEARVVAYMDVDLSTDLHALLPLVAAVIDGHSDIAIGSRLAPGARVERSSKRELISRAYNLVLHTALHSRFSDAQCGFKAVRADVARRLVPQVSDESWFFDTELLVLAQRAGLRIHEVPVDWIEDPDSRVDLVATALGDLRGVARLLAGARVPRFVAIGIASTLAYALLYLGLRGYVSAGAANALALATTAVLNTAANRRLTFGVRGRGGLVRHHAFGAAVFLLTLGLTSGSLWVLQDIVPSPPRVVEVIVLVIASLAATATRYVALRFLFEGRDDLHRRPAPKVQPGAAARRPREPWPARSSLW